MRRFLTVPEGVRPEPYFACLAGMVVLAGAFGLQATMLAMLLIPLPVKIVTGFTVFGGTLYLPEHDIVIYLAGIVFTAVLAAMGAWGWHRRVEGLADRVTGRYLIGAGLSQAIAGVIGTICFLILFFRARHYTAKGLHVPVGYLAAFGGVALLSIGAALLGSPSKPEGRFTRAITSLLTTPSLESVRARLSPLDLVIPIVIVALVYVVDGKGLAGQIFLQESMLHWDYFGMGPTLAFKHGLPLGQVHSTYGVGWPVLLAWLSPLVPLSYGHLIQMGSIYACLYFLGAYLLLRLLVRPAAAALGTVFVMMQLILAMGDISVWRIPSVTLLRWPMDVWLMVALVLHFKTGKKIWGIAAGAVVGLAIVFVLDTGLYLAAGFGVYWLLTLGLEKRRFDKGWFLPAVAVGVVIVFVGLGIASRWTLFGSAFWGHWIETVLEFGGGFGMLPLSIIPNEITLSSFAIYALSGLTLFGYALVKALHRRASHMDAFLGFLGFYGLLCLLHFIGRSGDYTPFRLWFPLGIAYVMLAERAYGVAAAGFRRRWGSTAKGRSIVAVPALGVVVLLAGLIALPSHLFRQPFLDYPNPLNHLRAPSERSQLCLISKPQDICGMPAKLSSTVVQFQQIVDRLDEIKAQGKSFAAIEEAGSLFYLASDTAPWDRYSRLFVSLRTKKQLDRSVKALRDHPVDYVLTRQPNETDATYEKWPLYSFGYGLRPDSAISDTWSAFGAVVQKDYALVEKIGPFEIRKRIAP